MTKRAGFWFFLVALNLIVIVIAVEAYYFFGSAPYRDVYCGPFGVVDDEIGWVLKPRAESCIRSPLFHGRRDYDSKVFIDRYGFRKGSVDDDQLRAEVMFTGDSWTFGQGVAYEQTFAGLEQKKYGRTSVVLASPAYSGAQALLLARRWIEKVKPKHLVYLELGFLGRSVCTGRSRPGFILKPCYWYDGRHVEFVTPRPGLVTAASRWSLYPGGMLGAGQSSLDYFLIARPVLRAHQILVCLGLLSGFGHDFKPIVSAEGMEMIRESHLGNLIELARRHGVHLVLIDPGGYYTKALAGRSEGLTYIGSEEWVRKVAGPASALPAEQAWVPGDHHFGPGQHDLIAGFIDAKLAGR